MNTMARVIPILVVLAAASTPATAQRWGGGGPGVSPGQRHDARRDRVIVVVLPVYAPVIAVPLDVNGYTSSTTRRLTSRSYSGGGSWDGSRPAWGGSPAPVNHDVASYSASNPRDRTPASYTSTRPSGMSGRSMADPARTRDAYRARLGIP